MLLNSNNTLVLIVDAQERILPAIHQRDGVVSRMRWLGEICDELSIPILITEQYPKGLGYTIESLTEVLSHARVVEKTHFSALREPVFREVLNEYQAKQIVIMGMETHVCVMQTALDLLAEGYQVYVPVDAVGSRRPADKDAALKRMESHGAELITTEMAPFEWLEKSGTDTFRHISRNWLK